MWNVKTQMMSAALAICCCPSILMSCMAGTCAAKLLEHRTAGLSHISSAYLRDNIWLNCSCKTPQFFNLLNLHNTLRVWLGLQTECNYLSTLNMQAHYAKPITGLKQVYCFVKSKNHINGAIHPIQEQAECLWVHFSYNHLGTDTCRQTRRWKAGKDCGKLTTMCAATLLKWCWGWQ